MTPAPPPSVLRPGLLDGLSVLLASAEPPSRFGEAVAARCAELGAHVGRVVVEPTSEEPERREGLDVVVWDGASLAGPRDVLDGAWLALRPAARAGGAGARPGPPPPFPPPPPPAGAPGPLDPARPAARRRRRRSGPRRAREPRAHAVDRMGAPRDPPGRDPARRGHRAGGGRRARRLPRLAGGRLLLRLRVPAGRGMSYKVTRLDDVEPLPGPGTLRWLPVRHELGIGAFGTNAYMAENAGDDVVEPHTEEGTGHEELYFVARGAATFTLDGETVHAPAGTYVFLPDPTTRRHATADEAGTTVLSFGGWRDRPFQVSGW